MKASFNIIPIGYEGLYCVQRTLNGEQHYLASVLYPSKIGRYDYGLCRGTIIILEGRRGTGEAPHVWLPWATDDLPSKRPMSMFPPSRRSAYDHSARA